MRRAKPQPAAFLGLTAIVVIAAATELAQAWPVAESAAHSQSAALTTQATSAPLSEAAANYHLAALLDPGNQSAYLGLARTFIAAGHPGDALQALERAGEGSDAAHLRIRTLLELGRYFEASAHVRPLTSATRSDHDLTLAAITYTLAGQPGAAGQLMARAASSDTRTQLTRIQAGGLPLASELAANGLPESSKTLLMKQPPSFERDVLLARILYASHTESDLAAAADYLHQATALNPADAEAHRVLAAVYSDLKQPAASADQLILVKKLEAQRP